MAALLRRLGWLTGRVVRLVRETPRSRTIGLIVPGWPGHHPGQHVDLRLPGAERSYAIASAPEDRYLELTVARVAGGEVSGYLVDDLREGDRLELRGPLGADFRWDATSGGPLLLIAAGPGIAPLRSMLRHHRAIESEVPVRLLYSVPDALALPYPEEIMRFATSDQVDVNLTYTRRAPARWNGYRRRIDAPMLAEVSWPPAEHPVTYVCGPTTFVDTAAALLVAAGHDPDGIHAERFGGGR
ncbi:oxidoreductase [Actinoplanes sp. TBRC 11911]|uniref:ferredoxin reductase n=1 Tax=Actinoplanes sp. TBRC 11911 TaxID=2729386 RepID=UPI00145F0D0D|nr:ferredoxin reductase [Actinoplanes sp. TBRC 11911]NMO55519.1 oxidoreductase [Actinoplanes sp. TBRC 11911]